MVQEYHLEGEIDTDTDTDRQTGRQTDRKLTKQIKRKDPRPIIRSTQVTGYKENKAKRW